MDTSTPVTTAVTVGIILDRYERDCLDALSPGTVYGYRLHIKLLRQWYATAVASELRPRDFAEFLNVKKGRTSRTRALAVLSSAFTHAVSSWFWLETNVLRDVKRQKNPPRDRLVLKEELEGLVAIAPIRVGLAMQLAALTGQRQSDILKFRWSDIKGDSIHLQQNKTGKRLALKISADLEAVLDRCWLLEAGGKDGSEFILPTGKGRQYTSSGFRTLWQRVINRWCKLGNPRYQFRDLRAMAATRCSTPEAARRLLGHTNIAMTLRVYRRGTETADALDMPL